MRRLIIAALLGSVLVLGGCGGEDGGKQGGARLSAAEYRTQLTRLCTESEREAAQIGGVQGANAAALAEYFDKIAALQSRRRAQFERLRPPADLQDEHAQIAPLLAQEIAAIEQAATSFRAGSDPLGAYKMFKTSQTRALRRQSELLAKMKVSGCRSNAGASASAAPGPS